MRLSLAVNGTGRCIASMPCTGYLSAHLNLSSGTAQSEEQGSVRIVGIDTSREAQTVTSEWPTISVAVGDQIELEVLPEGSGDQPILLRNSRENATNLFQNRDLGRQLLGLVEDFESRLTQLLSESKTTEPPDEHKKFERAVVEIITELGEHFLYPVYRRHPQLVPEQLKHELL